MTHPVVTTDPAVNGGRPHIRGIPVDALASAHWVGDDACDEYGASRAELLTACWHVAWYGPTWLQQWRRWKPWADRWCGALAREEYDVVPDAPRKDEHT